MKFIFFTCLLSLCTVITKGQQPAKHPLNNKLPGQSAANNNSGNVSNIGDTTQGYFLIKPGISEIVSRINNAPSENMLRFDSLGLSLYRNDSALIKFRDLPASLDNSFPILTIDPSTKQVYTRELPIQNLDNIIPEQTGQEGKFLLTDGQNLLWQNGKDIYTANYNSLYPGNDFAIIQHAVNVAKEGDKIYLENRTYELSSGIFISKSVEFFGQANTVIKRSNEIISTLSEAVLITATKLIVSNPSSFIAGDAIILYKDSTWWGTSYIAYVNNISGDTLSLNNSIGSYNGESNSTFSSGTKIKKVFNLFSLAAPGDVPTFSTGFNNITFDGNRAYNRANLAYNHSFAIYAGGIRQTNIDNCTFINMPTETIIGHNLSIKNSRFRDLNGSAVHFSMSKQTSRENNIHSDVTNNVFSNTNQVSTSDVTHHSEGVLTTSNSGGYFTASQNRFTNIGEAIIGALYPSLTFEDYGTNNVIFTDNIIDSAKRLVYLIDTTTSGEIKGVIIKNNSITNTFDETDFSNVFSVAGRETMVIQGYRSFAKSETISGLAQSGAAEGQTIKWDGVNWIAKDDDGKPAGANGNLQYNSSGAMAATGKLTWENETQKLGVGTDSPQVQLHVKRSGELLRLETTAAQNSGTGFLSYYDPAGRKGYIGYGNMSNDNFTIINEKNADIQIGTNADSSQLVIKPGGNIGVGTSLPEETAIFQLQSTSKGFLPPRLTDSQKTAIIAPANGLMIYNLTNNSHEYFNGTEWKASAPIAQQPVEINNQTTNIYTIQLSDMGRAITFKDSAAIIVNIPAGLGEGFFCSIIQLGIGRIEIVAQATEVLNRQGHLKTAGQYAEARLIAIDNNKFILSGDMGN